jgi:hypothetical protein
VAARSQRKEWGQATEARKGGTDRRKGRNGETGQPESCRHDRPRPHQPPRMPDVTPRPLHPLAERPRRLCPRDRRPSTGCQPTTPAPQPPHWLTNPKTLPHTHLGRPNAANRHPDWPSAHPGPPVTSTIPAGCRNRQPSTANRCGRGRTGGTASGGERKAENYRTDPSTELPQAIRSLWEGEDQLNQAC